MEVEARRQTFPNGLTGFMGRLAAHFEWHPNRHGGLAWTEVRARLENYPAKLWSLREMERTGGERPCSG